MEQTFNPWEQNNRNYYQKRKRRKTGVRWFCWLSHERIWTNIISTFVDERDAYCYPNYFVCLFVWSLMLYASRESLASSGQKWYFTIESDLEVEGLFQICKASESKLTTKQITKLVNYTTNATPIIGDAHNLRLNPGVQIPNWLN